MTRIDTAELTELATGALHAAGLSETDAARVADVLVLADLFGIHTHGVSRIPQYLDRVLVGGIDIDAAVTTERVAPGLARVDGANGLGPLVGSHALDAALTCARDTGIGAAFARHSNHFGPVMPYLYQAARQGFAAVIASNATTTIAPWGGRDARLGNNPLGWGMPRPGGDPVLLDVAMSVVARAKIRAAAKAGESIPDTWATDGTGAPTTDPHAALEGFLQPVGAHKGYGLALMVDMFAGLLSGAGYLTRVSSWNENPDRPQDLGHVFILVDTTRLMPPDVLSGRVDDFTGVLHDTPPADPRRPVQVPGERELANLHRRQREGIDLADDDLRALREVAARR
ncbi:Ldh family oxidoreductase [Amycolatopsis thermoflava]|uniref:Ldh family oxidoreductase n=1 Tax=Amycolatopsis thermoflava TaxID=84480 RepID=UPI0036546C06